MESSTFSRQLFIGLGIIAFIFCITLLPLNNQRAEGATRFHSEEELAYYQKYHISPLLPPEDTTTFFKTSNWCAGCHGSDPSGYAMHSPDGTDINTYDDWRATMMANSAKDPFWRAKVSHETLLHPGLADEIENTCTSCHAPLGHYNAFFKGQPHYTMSDLQQDTIGIDGVSCVACHQMKPDSIGFLNTGNLLYDTTGLIYGPYEEVFKGPMGLYVGAEPIKGEHINDAGLCAGCHTLIVETLDLEGNPTGNSFVEQATYHEWLNSVYAFDDVTCQGCHMPRVEDSIVIATGYLSLDGQAPFGRHELAGANVFMLNLMKEHREELGINAEPVHFDSVLAATNRMLQNQTLDSELQFLQVEDDTAYFDLKLVNKAGHKFPSGYPSRIAFVEFKVTDENGNTLFHSGKLDADNALMDVDANFEPHHKMINQEGQVQIYELVNGDVNGDFSTVLERGAIALKDNRLLPIGFKRQHYTYDTVQIAGNAATDPDFGPETPPGKGVYGGSDGSDIVHYHIPLNGYSGLLDVTATVHYQSLPPRWMEEMFGEDTPEINAFQTMYNTADPSIVQITQSGLTDVPAFASSTQTPQGGQVHISPNPSLDGKVRVSFPYGKMRGVRILAADGRWLRHFPVRGNVADISLPDTPGIYYLDILTENGRVTRKVERR